MKKKWPPIILGIYVLLILAIFGAWLGCINRADPFTALGCVCPHPKFSALHILVPDEICSPNEDPPQIYPGILFK